MESKNTPLDPLSRGDAIKFVISTIGRYLMLLARRFLDSLGVAKVWEGWSCTLEIKNTPLNPLSRGDFY